MNIKAMKKAAADEDRRRRKELLHREILLLSSRAGKLLLKGKPFIVIAVDEPYYMDVYRTIRKHEQEKARWSDEDESKFREALDFWADCRVWREGEIQR